MVKYPMLKQFLKTNIMKKIIFILSIISNIFNFFSQQMLIRNVNISPNGSNSIDVNLEVDGNDVIVYQDYTYEINENIINLKVCYEYYTTPSDTTLNNTFNLPISFPVNYTINIEIYRVFYANPCDYTDLQDSATLNFTTPLNETVYLGIDTIENHNNQIEITPNPIKVKLSYTVLGNLAVNSLFIYNILGEEVIYFNGDVNNRVINNLNNGIYFVIFNTNKGNIRKRIIVDK